MSAPSLTLAQAQELSGKINILVDVAENKTALADAVAAAGGDLMKLMVGVMPKVITILGPVAVEYGFTGDQMGLMGMMNAMKLHESDPAVAATKAAIMGMIMPGM